MNELNINNNIDDNTTIKNSAPNSAPNQNPKPAKKNAERSGFLVISKRALKILSDKDMTNSAIALYIMLLNHRHNKKDDYYNKCFPSQEVLSDEIHISQRSVIRAVKALEEKGLIRVFRPGITKPNYYFFPYEDFYSKKEEDQLIRILQAKYKNSKNDNDDIDVDVDVDVDVDDDVNVDINTDENTNMCQDQDINTNIEEKNQNENLDDDMAGINW